MSLEDSWSMAATSAKMADLGAFGENCRFVSCDSDDSLSGQDQFASIVRFGTVVVGREGSKRLCSHQLVFKLKKRVAKSRDWCHNDWEFHNEIYFYERLQPFFFDCVHRNVVSDGVHVPTLSRYFYGRNDCGDMVLQDVIVVENACPQGYRLSDIKMHLDFDHMVVALKTLAKFHGLSYRAKHKDAAKFIELLADVKGTSIYDEGDNKLPRGTLKELFSVALDRVVERGGYDQACRWFRDELLSDINRALRRTIIPSEPFSVLCHGDYLRNNLLFRYDDRGRPVDALVFDMGTVRYGSPALDLSSLLFMNADRQLHEAHWHELMDVYCSSLAAAVSDQAVPVPDRAQIDAEMREHALFGLAPLTFFVRMMVEVEKSGNCTFAFHNAGDDEILNTLLSSGGDRATDLIADAIQQFFVISYTENVSF